MPSVKDHHPHLIETLASLNPDRKIPRRNRLKAEVSFYHLEGQAVVLKSYLDAFQMKLGFSRPFVREVQALLRAETLSIGCTPKILAINSAHRSILMEQVPGKPLKSFSQSLWTRQHTTALLTAVAALHRSGIAHGDLHWRDVLVQEHRNFEPAHEAHSEARLIGIVDFATASLLPEREDLRSSARRSLVFRQKVALDKISVIRMITRILGQDPDQSIYALAEGQPEAIPQEVLDFTLADDASGEPFIQPKDLVRTAKWWRLGRRWKRRDPKP